VNQPDSHVQRFPKQALLKSNIGFSFLFAYDGCFQNKMQVIFADIVVVPNVQIDDVVAIESYFPKFSVNGTLDDKF
jgi:hypothetical protein